MVSFKCHWICLQCAIDNMSILFNIMAWSCAGAKSKTMLPMFCDPIYGVRSCKIRFIQRRIQSRVSPELKISVWSFDRFVVINS